MRYSPERVQEIFAVVERLLGENDYRQLTMAEIARACSCSKETLYRWFGSKAGLFAEMVRNSSNRIGERMSALFVATDATPQAVLSGFCHQYLRTVLAESSVRVNRVAISGFNETPEFAQLLLENGRDNAVPWLERYLGELQERGAIAQSADMNDMVNTLLGLAAGDMQIRRLLGRITACPADDLLEHMADRAAARFLLIFTAAEHEESV
jgi:AcrR family transcriptional regulator